MVWTIRMRNSSPSSSKINLCTTYRAWRGLKLALQDPKVYIFALYDFSALLGLGFVQFFPTSVMVIYFLGWCSDIFLGYLQSVCNNGFLNHYHTLTCIVRYLALKFTWLYHNLERRGSLLQFYVLSMLAMPVSQQWCFIFLSDLFIRSDVTGERFWHITVWFWVVIVGYIIAQATMTVGGRYVSLFLLATGYVGSSMTLVWVSNSFPRPPSKRAASIGIINGFGNLGNL